MSFAGRAPTLRLGHSVVTGNGTGVGFSGVATVQTYGDNNLLGNTTTVSGGTLTTVGNQ